MATQVSGADAWLTLNDMPLSFEPGDENLAAKAEEHKENRFRITRNAPDDLELRADGELLETERYGRWSWMPRGFAGLYQLEVRVPGHARKVASVRVFPSKLSFERYKEMLTDITQISTDLLFELHSPASEKATMQSVRERSSAVREFELIRTVIRRLEPVIAQIRRSPHCTLIEHTEQCLLHEVHRFSSDTIPIPGPALELPISIGRPLAMNQLPHNWAIQSSALTYDVYENQLLKHFLWRQLLTRIYSVEDRARNEIKRRESDRVIKLRQGWEDDESAKIEALQSALVDCSDMANLCLAWGSAAFLKSVKWPALASRPTQVLQKHPYYSRFYQVYLQFQQELRLSLNADRYLTRLSTRKMWELYETWSAFRITQLAVQLLAEAGYQVISSNGFFEVRDDQFHFEVDRDASIKLARGERTVVIRYQPTYPPAAKVSSGLVSTARQQRTPDLAMEVWRHGQANRVIIFDAKYRSEFTGNLQIYLDDDLSKMGDYLQVIRWKPKDPRQRPHKVVSSAYIMYPGNFLEHDADMPESGALPLVPKMPQFQAVSIAVRQILEYAGLF